MSAPSENSATIRALIIDYAEVFSFAPTPEDIARMAGALDCDPERFRRLYDASRAPYDRGDVEPEVYWQRLASQTGMRLEPRAIEKLRQWDIEMWGRLNRPMLVWLEQLRPAGFKTAILSNMPLDMASYVRRNFAWLGHFDRHIFSAEVRQVKPDPEIYQTCLQALGSEPSETLFIDDRDLNLEVAAAAGIRGLRFQSVEQLRRDLQSMSFPVLPPQCKI